MRSLQQPVMSECMHNIHSVNYSHSGDSDYKQHPVSIGLGNTARPNSEKKPKKKQITGSGAETSLSPSTFSSSSRPMQAALFPW